MTQIQKKHDLQEDLDKEYGWCLVRGNDGSFGDTLLDLAQSEYEKECDLMDRKCEDWVNTKIGENKNVH